MRKARDPSEAERLEQVPNIGPSLADDLRRLGIAYPAQLRGQRPVELYARLCALTGQRHDPCVLDAFMAAVAFVENADARPWWRHTAERKRLWPTVEAALRAQAG